MGFLDKVKDLVSKNADKVDTVIDKAGDIADQRTQGKYAQQINKAQDAAKKAARQNAGGTKPGQVEPGQATPGQPTSPPVPPAPPTEPTPPAHPTAPPLS